MVMILPKSLSHFFKKNKKNHTFVTNSPQDGILLTQIFIQILHINHCTATIMTYDHFPERHMS